MHYLYKRILVGMAIGALVGTTVIGIGGRLAMRGIALMGGLKGGFSWGGTFEVVLLGLIIGAIAGGLFGTLRKYLFKNPLLSGMLFGLFVFMAILVLPIEGKGAAKGFPDLRLEVYLIFGTLHALFGLILAVLFNRLTGK